MRRILYYCSDKLILLGWKSNRLVGRVEFDCNEEGYALFEKVMVELPDVPIKILINIQEEDFQRETIPHVNGKAKDAVIKRLMDRYYRDEKYTNIIFQGRLEEGRKDDKVLLSSLNPSTTLQQWLDLIDRLQLPVAGIWSVPLMSHKMLNFVDDKQAACIIVSKDKPGHYRQSLFVGEELILSRKTNARSSMPLEEESELLLSAVDQLYHFATNKRFVGFKDKITVACILNDALYSSLCRQKISENIAFSHISEKKIVNSYESDVTDVPVMDLLYSGLCYKEASSRDHYASKGDKEYFIKHLVNKRFFQAAIALSLVLFASAIAIAVNGYFLKKQAELVQVAYQDVENAYQERFSTIQERINSVDSIQALIDESLSEESMALSMPTDIFDDLSQILSDKEFLNLHLTKIKWKRYSGSEYEMVSKLFPQESEEEEMLDAEGDLNMSYDDQAKESKIFIHIGGDIALDSLSYEETVNAMFYFNDALKSIDGVVDVYMLSSPVDLRTQSRFADAKGIRLSQGAGASSRSFEFILAWDEKVFSVAVPVKNNFYTAESQQ